MNAQSITDQLTKLNIEFQNFEHPPVFTCEESQRLCPPMPGKKNKNLFFRDDKGKRYFLISMTQDKQLSIQELADLIGEKRLSFASERRLKAVLDVEPGSVGILALLNDKEALSSVYIDQELLDEEWFQSHPAVNDATVAFKTSGLSPLLQHSGHQWQAINL